MKIGKFIKAERLKRGKTVKQIGGLSHPAIVKIETGINSPTFRTLCVIAKTFKMPLWKLIKKWETA